MEESLFKFAYLYKNCYWLRIFGLITFIVVVFVGRIKSNYMMVLEFTKATAVKCQRVYLCLSVVGLFVFQNLTDTIV